MVLDDEFDRKKCLENAILKEQIDCRCEERIGYVENGDYSAHCDGLCNGCYHYDSDYIKCDIYENVRVTLEEDAQRERLGIDDDLN
jgi:hypothetical protein